ncbi:MULTISPECIES: hypothetical protein, partial [unclassified Microcoleus]|uniref:hypothetical protein n=1 Tax=unclassified Microcoleus TaxID=2642155 RepID=UPI0025F5D9C2
GATRYRKNLSLTKLEYIDRSCSWLAINYSASPIYGRASAFLYSESPLTFLMEIRECDPEW